MKKLLLLAGALVSISLAASGRTCEGGVYLNPQVIRGEGAPQVVSAANELSDFLGRTGLSAEPVINVSNAEETMAALKRPRPPCWVFGNPVVGLGSGYRAAAVNMEEIQPAVFVLGDLGTEKDPQPVDLGKLGPDEQAQVLAKLKGATCYGIKSGVTTALVKAEKLCGHVVEVRPQQGMGQSYLPTKAAFEWRPGRWIGWITRAQGTRSASMRDQVGMNSQVHLARLTSVPTQRSSWGYGIYLRPDLPGDVAGKVAAQFSGLQQPASTLARTLDIGKTFRFATPSAAEVEGMRTALGLTP